MRDKVIQEYNVRDKIICIALFLLLQNFDKLTM